MSNPVEVYRKNEKKESHFALFSIRKELELFWWLGGIPFQIHFNNFGTLEPQQLLEYTKLAVVILPFILPSFMLLSMVVIDPDLSTNNSFNFVETVCMHRLHFIPIWRTLCYRMVWQQNEIRMVKVCEKLSDINHKLEMYYNGCNVLKEKKTKRRNC